MRQHSLQEKVEEQSIEVVSSYPKLQHADVWTKTRETKTIRGHGDDLLNYSRTAALLFSKWSEALMRTQRTVFRAIHSPSSAPRFGGYSCIFRFHDMMRAIFQLQPVGGFL